VCSSSTGANAWPVTGKLLLGMMVWLGISHCVTRQLEAPSTVSQRLPYARP
jgi:hypothetical protein